MTIIILSLLMIGCNSQSSNNDSKEKELLEKEIKLLKKEKELLQANSSDNKIDESSVDNEKETQEEEVLEVKLSVGDRIIEIKELYSEIQRAPNKEHNCISASETRNDELREYSFENTAKECQLADEFMYQQVNLIGYEWGETTTFYYKEDQCFFVYLTGGAEACGYEYRVYYDRTGEVIRVLLAENCDGGDVGSSDEVTDEKRKKEILSSIANSEKELRTILKN